MIRERVEKVWPQLGFHFAVVAYVLLWVNYHGTEMGMYVASHLLHSDFDAHSTRLVLLATCALTLTLSISRPKEYLSPLVVGAGLLTLLATIRLFIVPTGPNLWFWVSPTPIYYGPMLSYVWFLVFTGVGAAAFRKWHPHSIAACGGALLLVLPLIQARLTFGNGLLGRVVETPAESLLTFAIFGGALLVVFIRVMLNTPTEDTTPAEQADNGKPPP